MWEYKTIVMKSNLSLFGGKFDSDDIDDLLNSYGEEGWELVSVSPSNKDFGSTGNLILFLKRYYEK